MTNKSKRKQQANSLVSRLAALSVANARGAVCCPQPRTTRPRRRNRRMQRATGVGGSVDPFLHCVLGPTAQVGGGSGAPDGSVDPTVVIEHRQTVVLTPRPGQNGVTIALVSSPYGAIGLADGQANVTVNSVDLSNPNLIFGPLHTGVVPATPGTDDGLSNYAIIPFAESLRPSGNVLDFNAAGIKATHYRVLTSQAKASYTGSTFVDQGTAATCRTTFGVDEDVANPMVTITPQQGPMFARGVRFPNEPPLSFTDVASMPGSRVFPVRESANLLNPPTNFDFQEMREAWVPFTQYGEGAGAVVGFRNLWFPSLMWSITPATPTVGPIPGLGHAPMSFYSASGMSPDASVTFEVRTCVEYRLSFSSPASRFARMPPIERPLAMKTVKDISRTLPSSIPVTPETETNGWLGNALSWYGNTMKTIVGGVWSTAGGLLKESRVPIVSGLGQVVRRSGRTLTGVPGRQAIAY